MWLIITYLISFSALLGGIMYETNKQNGTIPRYLYPIAIIALMPVLNTIVLAGLLICWLMEKRK